MGGFGSGALRWAKVEELVCHGEAQDPIGPVSVVGDLTDRALHRRSLLDEVADPVFATLGVGETNHGQAWRSGGGSCPVVDDTAFGQTDAGMRRVVEDRVAAVIVMILASPAANLRPAEMRRGCSDMVGVLQSVSAWRARKAATWVRLAQPPVSQKRFERLRLKSAR